MWVINNRKIFLGISGLFIAASIVLMSIWGLNVGIDFKGGSLTEVSYPSGAPDAVGLQEKVDALNFGTAVIQRVGDTDIQIKTRALSEPERQELVTALASLAPDMKTKSFTSIGPSVGKELKTKSIFSLIVVGIAMILFIAYAFRKVSKPISGWKYGFMTIIALIHDVIITAGVFTVISHFTGAEADTLFVVALLTVLGLSVNDTIVVFDRIRENLSNKTEGDFKHIVGKSLSETMLRSINTSLSVIIVLFALFFVGPESTKIFALTLACGMFFGTYSSIFIASPLLTLVEDWQLRKRA